MTETVGTRKRAAVEQMTKENNRALQEIRRRRGNHPEGDTPLDLETERKGTKLEPARSSW